MGPSYSKMYTLRFQYLPGHETLTRTQRIWIMIHIGNSHSWASPLGMILPYRVPCWIIPTWLATRFCWSLWFYWEGSVRWCWQRFSVKNNVCNKMIHRVEGNSICWERCSKTMIRLRQKLQQRWCFMGWQRSLLVNGSLHHHDIVPIQPIQGGWERMHHKYYVTPLLLQAVVMIQGI